MPHRRPHRWTVKLPTQWTMGCDAMRCDAMGPCVANICCNSAIIAAIAFAPRLSRKSGNFNFNPASVLPIRFSARNERGTHSTDVMTNCRTVEVTD